MAIHLNDVNVGGVYYVLGVEFQNGDFRLDYNNFFSMREKCQEHMAERIKKVDKMRPSERPHFAIFKIIKETF